MIVGALIGLLILAILSFAVSCVPGVQSCKPFAWVWMLFSTSGALIGHFVG